MSGRGGASQLYAPSDLTGLVITMFGLSVSSHAHRLHKGLLAFTTMSILSFATNLASLLHKAEAPPGFQFLLSTRCPLPSEEVARRAVSRRRWFQPDVANRLHGRSSVSQLGGFGNGTELNSEELLPLGLKPGTTVDLCSSSWAVGNAHLIISSMLMLIMRSQAMRVLRARDDLFADLDLLGRGDFGATGRLDAGAERVVVLRHPDAANGATAKRQFVPFSGRSFKLDL